MTGIPQAEGSKSKRWYDGGEAQRECAPHAQPPLNPKPKPDPSSPPQPKLKLKPTPKSKPGPSGPSPHTTGTNNTSTRHRRCGPSRPLCTRACRSCLSGCYVSSTRRTPKERHCNCHSHSQPPPRCPRDLTSGPEPLPPLHSAPAAPPPPCPVPTAPCWLPSNAPGRPVVWRGRPPLAVCPNPGCRRMRTGATRRARLSATLRRPTSCQRSSPGPPTPPPLETERGHLRSR